LRRGRILVVDDEEPIRELMKDILEDEGYHVELAESGEEALAMMERRAYDLVFLDIWLPGVDGMEVLRRVVEREPRPHVVIISGHGTVQSAVEAIKLGAYDFIEKPLSMERIIVVARNAVTEKRLREEREILLRAQEEVEFVGESQATKEILRLVEEMAPTEGTVLITGETGTGKELIARLIHARSQRARGRFVPLNCSAIPDELMESELFGYVRGAFTNAVKNKKGKLQMADGGTLFLDEIGDMSLRIQAKILRVIEEQRFEPLGSTEVVEIDTRFIAATNKNLQEEVRKGNFRRDLFYRINVLPIHIPPLRERPEDIIPIARYYLRRFSSKYNKPELKLSPSAERALVSYPWPGNVRELRNTVERAVILKRQGSVLEPRDLYLPHQGFGEEFFRFSSLQRALKAFEREFILRKLREHHWNITKTAEALGVDRSNLHRKMKILGIEKENENGES